MGKIKSKMVKKASDLLIKKDLGFSEDFEKNKRILRNTMPSKKIRNQMAGYLSRLEKKERLERTNMPKN